MSIRPLDERHVGSAADFDHDRRLPVFNAARLGLPPPFPHEPDPLRPPDRTDNSAPVLATILTLFGIGYTVSRRPGMSLPLSLAYTVRFALDGELMYAFLLVLLGFRRSITRVSDRDLV